MTQKIIYLFILLWYSSHTLAQLKSYKITDLPNDLEETSGLILYQDKYFITHNDSGNEPEIYILNLKGELIKTIALEDAKNRDWEDITQDDKGRVYLGDFGNNSNNREKCHIYILPSDFMKHKKVKPKKITFSYEDQKNYPPKKTKMNFDCEAFIWKEGFLYLFTKCRTKPFTGESRVYKIDPNDDKQKADYIGSIYLCQSGWKLCSVTAADYHAASNSLALLTYTKLYIITNFKENEFWNGDIRSYSLPLIKQREAICFDKENLLYSTDEERKGFGGGNLYKIQLK
ncbi:hypothetical protein [Crocinitomix algicola]|uniref:hypothetical protein n=1 Tax=Crocinitomix algicola TaxID=1740263 RepID=UPI000872B7C8|nr:hypothetical protein [Crocinitomix algicola]